MVAPKAPREQEMRNVTANVIPTAVGVLIMTAFDIETENKYNVWHAHKMYSA